MHSPTLCSNSLCYLVGADAFGDVTITIRASHLMSSVLTNLPEDSCIKISKNRVTKSRISVNNSSSSRVTQNFQATDHKEFLECMFHGKSNQRKYPYKLFQVNFRSLCYSIALQKIIMVACPYFNVKACALVFKHSLL